MLGFAKSCTKEEKQTNDHMPDHSFHQKKGEGFTVLIQQRCTRHLKRERVRAP